MAKPPCIRGLEKYKDGCPKRPWDNETEEGCPAWIELAVATQENPMQKEVRRQCIDIWTWQFQWAGLGIMEGSQQAAEGARNMVALACLVSTGSETSKELERVATKHLTKSKEQLLIDAEGKVK